MYAAAPAAALTWQHARVVVARQLEEQATAVHVASPGLSCPAATVRPAGDTIECFQIVTKARRLEEARAVTAVDVASIA
jgi:hypothetical protein